MAIHAVTFARRRNRIVLTYAPPATFKTSVLATVPAVPEAPKGDLWLLDADDGSSELELRWAEAGRARDRLHIVPCDHYNEFERNISRLPPGYGAYAVDTWSAAGIRSVHSLAGTVSRNYNPGMWGDHGGRMVDLFIAFCDQLRAMAAWGIVVLHERIEEIDDGQGSLTRKNERSHRPARLQIMPDLIGGARHELPRWCDFVWRQRIQRHGVAEWQCQPTAAVMAKSRGVPLPRIFEAHYARAFALIEESWAKLDSASTTTTTTTTTTEKEKNANASTVTK